MKNGIVRFAALYVFNVAVLLLIGLLFSGVRVGFNALWAAVILTLAALFVKPVLGSAFRKSAAKSSASRTKVGEKTVQYALVYVVELIVWVLTVWLSGVRASGFWAFVLPPLILLFGWMIYDQFDDRLRAKAGEVYDTVSAKISKRPDAAASAPTPDSPATTEARQELNDGLTPEQRRMLDELG
ncbi:phage holin family protein [Microbacterium sp. LWH10-1.2]|uniref:phage holin family protein n=1 Tax=unclassified Microbacterium TaxID=2609290 RepID=UPI00313A4534